MWAFFRTLQVWAFIPWAFFLVGVFTVGIISVGIFSVGVFSGHPYNLLHGQRCGSRPR
jgi:hypothetical protein